MQMSSWSDRRSVPSGSVMRTGGRGDPGCGGAANEARKSNIRPHLLGFFALTTFPVAGSRSANARSPNSPSSVKVAALSSSPIIDFTGYRQRPTTVPNASSAKWTLGPHRRADCIRVTHSSPHAARAAAKIRVPLGTEVGDGGGLREDAAPCTDDPASRIRVRGEGDPVLRVRGRANGTVPARDRGRIPRGAGEAGEEEPEAATTP